MIFKCLLCFRQTTTLTDDNNNTQEDFKQLLNSIDITNTKHIPNFIPPISNIAKVIKVYDGDTLTIITKLDLNLQENTLQQQQLYKFSVRLHGINCPELKTKNADEKICALLAKQELTDLTLNKLIYLKNIQKEKYGRILADIYLFDDQTIHVNQILLNKRLALPYYGKEKTQPISWLNYHQHGEML